MGGIGVAALTSAAELEMETAATASHRHMRARAAGEITSKEKG
jgi:hypothetical protein